jgi:hypothetical protein
MSTKTYTENPDEQTKWTERERKNTHSQTSRLENPEELQLHHNHEKVLFSTLLLLSAQCKVHYWWLVTWLERPRFTTQGITGSIRSASGCSWSWTTPECCSVSLLSYLQCWRQFKALKSVIWFFCDACHTLEVEIYYLARSGVDIIETGWNLSVEKRV